MSNIHLGDLQYLYDQVKALTNAITSGQADEIGNFFTDLIVRLKIMERELEIYKRNIPIMITQTHRNKNIDSNHYTDGIFQFDIPEDISVNQKLFILIPKEGSIEGNNFLELLVKNKVMLSAALYKESNTGQLVKISRNDIIPNKTVLIRIINAQTSDPKAIIINTSGLFDETLTNIFVGGEAIFVRPPKLLHGRELVSNYELNKVKEDLENFKKKFIFTNNTSAEEEAEKAPIGSIIFELEHD